MSQFGAEKFTTRSRAAIEAAQLAATTAGNTRRPSRCTCSSRCSRDAEGTAGTLVTQGRRRPARAARARPRPS